MKYPTDKLRTNPVLMLVVVIGFIVLVPVAVIALASGDPVWFIRDFKALPDRMVVYANGGSYEYLPGQAGFSELAQAVTASLDRGVQRASGIGLSPESLVDAYSKYMSVEAQFYQPVKLHASFNTYHPTRMLFLISGRHSQVPIVFMGTEEGYYSNAPVLVTNQPLIDCLAKLGYDISRAGIAY